MEMNDPGESPGMSREAQVLLIDREIARLKQKRNKFAPVSSLPPELLATVFRLLVDGYATWSWQGFMDLVGLTHVATHWRAVALDHASLWSNIASYVGPQWLDAFLARSRGAPLSVLLDIRSWEPPPETTAEIIHRIAELFAQASRLVSVSLTADAPTINTLLAAFTSPATRLKTLTIAIETSHDGGFEADLALNQSLSGLAAPALQELSFYDCTLSYTNPLYQNITSLTIYVEELDISFQELYESLKVVAPRLENLTLWFCSFCDVTVEDYDSITLPKLSKISLGRITDASITLLPLLRFPPSTSVSLTCVWLGNEEAQTISSALATAWISSSEPPIIESLSATNGPYEFLIRGWSTLANTQDQESDRKLYISSDPDSGPMDNSGYELSIIHTIMSRLPLRNLLYLELECIFHTPSDMNDILSQLSRLLSIKLCKHLDQLDTFLSFLLEDPFEVPSDDSTTPKPATITRLPSLQDIIFEEITGIKAHLKRLSTALQRRYPFGSCVRRVDLKRCGTIRPKALLQLLDGTGLEDAICSPE
ncbi:hypothetical protein BKA70DRAFT_1256669 [Coprinopsis sp. MPI-PUGE-AT-0042]|nr:hypothetical protein BKA70DRAFT_1256669 [Coprinopsis sp. MPI-PUGE-AT-0042]